MNGCARTVLYDEGNKSGVNGDANILFSHLNTLFERRYGKSCEKLRDCWLYLRKSQKFKSYEQVMSMKDKDPKRSRGESVSPSPISPVADVETGQDETEGEPEDLDSRPIGRDRAKRVKRTKSGTDSGTAKLLSYFKESTEESNWSTHCLAVSVDIWK